jgi:hypothetical protein
MMIRGGQTFVWLFETTSSYRGAASTLSLAKEALSQLYSIPSCQPCQQIHINITTNYGPSLPIPLDYSFRELGFLWSASAAFFGLMAE